MKKIKIRFTGILFVFILIFSIQTSVEAMQETDPDQISSMEMIKESEESEGVEERNIEDNAVIESTGVSEEFENAMALAIGSSVSNTITEDNRERVYRFSLAKSGRFTINITSYMQFYCMKIYDSSGTEIWYTDRNEWNSNLQYRSDEHQIDLINGSYYLKVNGYLYGTSYASTGNYTFSTSFTDAGETYPEPNDDFMTAATVSVSGTIRGQIAENDSYDIYQFTVPQDGRISLQMTSYMKYYCINLYDGTGDEIWYTDRNEWNSNLQYRTDTYRIDLLSGKYYIRINGYLYGTSYASTGNYMLGMNYTSAGATFLEPNNDFTTAVLLNSGSSVTGQIALNDRFDMFRFSLLKKQNIRLHMTSYMQYYTISVYNNAGEEQWYTDWNEWNENVGYRQDVYTINELQAGTYYIRVTGYYYGTAYASTGTYRLMLDTSATLADAEIASVSDKTYTGKAIVPSVTVTYNGRTLRKGIDYTVTCSNNINPGKASIVIKGIGEYTGTNSVQFYILPKKVSWKSVKSKKRGVAELKWKKAGIVSGYEIYRAYNKNYGWYHIKTIGGKKTSYKNKRLPHGYSYYYKIRAYKKVGDQKLYGGFSKVKKIRIK